MIGEGRSLAGSLNDTVKYARCAELAGYRRYWIAEHHNMPGIGSAATALIISHVASGTSTIRVGSGGMMLPNHTALVVAEQFGTLHEIYPGRIDLGVGRAPGANAATIQALRGHYQGREFADDVIAVLDYLADNSRQPARALPGRHDVPVWILGSSFYGAQLAGQLGLPFAFASHFAPRHLMKAIELYRENFRPSERLAEPYVIAGVCVFAADSEDEAEFLASSHQQWVANLHAGRPGLLPRPVEGYLESLSPERRYGLDQELACTVAGTGEQVGKWLREFADITGANELMIDSRIYDVNARCRSFEIVAQAMGIGK